MRRIDHNPCVPGPDRQIARLRPCHSAEVLNPSIEVGRRRVVIRETGTLIECVDQVGAIRGARMMTGIESDLQNREALVAGEGSRSSRLVLMILCERSRDACQAEQKQQQEHGGHGGFGRVAHSVL